MEYIYRSVDAIDTFKETFDNESLNKLVKEKTLEQWISARRWHVVNYLYRQKECNLHDIMQYSSYVPEKIFIRALNDNDSLLQDSTKIITILSHENMTYGELTHNPDFARWLQSIDTSILTQPWVVNLFHHLMLPKTEVSKEISEYFFQHHPAFVPNIYCIMSRALQFLDQDTILLLRKKIHNKSQIIASWKYAILDMSRNGLILFPSIPIFDLRFDVFFQEWPSAISEWENWSHMTMDGVLDGHHDDELIQKLQSYGSTLDPQKYLPSLKVKDPLFIFEGYKRVFEAILNSEIGNLENICFKMGLVRKSIFDEPPRPHDATNSIHDITYWDQLLQKHSYCQHDIQLSSIFNRYQQFLWEHELSGQEDVSFNSFIKNLTFHVETPTEYTIMS